MNPSITIKRMEPPKGIPSYPWWAYVLNHSKGQYIGEGYASEDAARRAAMLRSRQLDVRKF